jgi:hypothetical protein
MMSLEALSYYRKEAAKKARAAGKSPLLIPESIHDTLWADVPPSVRERGLKGIPNFGDYRPTGYYITKAVLVDKCGVGDAGRSLTIDELLDWAVPGEGLAMIEEGQFQVVVASFKPGKRPAGFRALRDTGVFESADLDSGGGGT